jgi:hypothetical protein
VGCGLWACRKELGRIKKDEPVPVVHLFTELDGKLDHKVYLNLNP